MDDNVYLQQLQIHTDFKIDRYKKDSKNLRYLRASQDKETEDGTQMEERICEKNPRGVD